MAEHYASAIVDAPAHQVYELFTHFNDFPKFMRFVKEVTYRDDQRSHWVVQVLRHNFEWDAVNEDWVADQQVGWRSTRGLKNTGKVKFRALGESRTMIDVYISYSPPSGPLGALGENLGLNTYFETMLQEELNNFVHMVEEAPPGALDPMSSHYLFHDQSAVRTHSVTKQQQDAMEHDPMMSSQALAEREARIEHEKAQKSQAEQEREAELKRRSEIERKAMEELRDQLAREAERRQREEERIRQAMQEAGMQRAVPDPAYHTLGGRGAALDRTSLGERDALRPRHPDYHQDPMTARNPRVKKTVPLNLDEKYESPWYLSIRGVTEPLPPTTPPEPPPASP
jgi:ribosome-associated toxin RatA of RatAB toxin-antitoxin module